MRTTITGFTSVLALTGILVLGASAATTPPPKPAPKAATKATAAPKTNPKPAAKIVAAKKPAKNFAKPAHGPAITQTRDLVYATLPGYRPLTLDLYQPPRTPKDFPKPALVFVHGGAWKSGDARQGGGSGEFTDMLTALAAKGYVVASVNYRLSGEARYPAALQDVKTAIRWLRANAADYDIDTTRVAVWGEEAGGQIAALAGASCGVMVLEPDGDPGANAPSDCVQAVIDWHGISDLASLTKGNPGPTPAGAYLGCEPAQCAPVVARNASPMAFITAATPPFLILEGAVKSVPPEQSQELADALQAAHLPVEVLSLDDGDSALMQKTVDAIADFLDRTFPKKAPDKKPARPSGKGLPF